MWKEEEFSVLVKRGGDYLAIKAEDIAYFYAAHKLVCLVDNKGQKFILDKSLGNVKIYLLVLFTIKPDKS